MGIRGSRKDKFYSFRVETDLAERVARAAEAEHRSPANYIRHVLMEHLTSSEECYNPSPMVRCLLPKE